MDPVLVVTVGGEDFRLENPSVQDVRDVKHWTGGEFASKQAWFSAIIREDADALLAAYVIAKRRKGVQVTWEDVTKSQSFSADIEAKFVDGDREVEAVVERNDDDSPKVDARGNLIPVLDAEGRQTWRDVTSGQVIPFGKTDQTSGTGPTPSSSGVTGTGTQGTAVS